MSFKFNWGHGIMIAIFLFIVFIGSFVYRSLFGERFDHKLVSEKYYEEEINFQKEIDRQKNALQLQKDIRTQKTDKGLKIIFPPGLEYSGIQGKINLLYMKNRAYDYKADIQLQDSVVLIPQKLLLSGIYHLKINWDYNGTGYQYKENLNF